MLGLYDRPLITEKIEAWEYGPVIPSIYYLFRDNANETVHFSDYFDDTYRELDDQEKDITRQVIDAYGDMSGSQLIQLTHEEDAPWSEHYDRFKTNIIPNEAIRKYFRDKSDE